MARPSVFIVTYINDPVLGGHTPVHIILCDLVFRCREIGFVMTSRHTKALCHKMHFCVM